MPLPQVNDRLKEVPAQVLRTLFASIGQLLLVADRLRARAAEQLSGSGDTTHTRPSEQGPAAAPPAAPPAPAAPAPAPAPAQDAESTRWRSLDKTGNVRLLNEEEEQEDQVVPGPVTQATQAGPEPVPAPAEYTPTEVVPAVSAAAEPASPEPPLAETAPAGTAPGAPAPADVPAPADLVPDPPAPADVPPPADVPAPGDLAPEAPAPADVPAPGDLAPEAPAPADVPAPADPTADLTPEETTPPAAAAGEALPVPNYDQLTVASLRARLRVLNVTQVQALLGYEKAHEGRPAVITMFERRLTKLSEGN